MKKKDDFSIPEGTGVESEETLNRILNGVKYLRQEVNFKKIVKTENTTKRKCSMKQMNKNVLYILENA